MAFSDAFSRGLQISNQALQGRRQSPYSANDPRIAGLAPQQQAYTPAGAYGGMVAAYNARDEGPSAKDVFDAQREAYARQSSAEMFKRRAGMPTPAESDKAYRENMRGYADTDKMIEEERKAQVEAEKAQAESRQKEMRLAYDYAKNLFDTTGNTAGLRHYLNQNRPPGMGEVVDERQPDYSIILKDRYTGEPVDTLSQEKLTALFERMDPDRKAKEAAKAKFAIEKMKAEAKGKGKSDTELMFGLYGKALEAETDPVKKQEIISKAEKLLAGDPTVKVATLQRALELIQIGGDKKKATAKMAEWKKTASPEELAQIVQYANDLSRLSSSPSSKDTSKKEEKGKAKGLTLKKSSDTPATYDYAPNTDDRILGDYGEPFGGLGLSNIMNNIVESLRSGSSKKTDTY